MAVVVLFIVHWQLSVFCQSFFLHRYGAHRQFTMSPRLGEVLQHPHRHRAELQLPEPARLRDPAPHAPRVQRHREGSRTRRSATAALVPGLFKMMYRTKRIYHEIAYFEKAARAALRRRLPAVALPRVDGQELADAHRLGRGLRGVLLVLRHRDLAVGAAARPLDHGRDPRRHRQLVRPPLRLPELRRSTTSRATRCPSTS